MTCTREDGSYTSADLGPSLPHHDLAHFVMENYLELTQGFYGNIQQGYSLQELSNKDIIKTLSWESWLAEIAARALQALSSGSCLYHELSELINSELSTLGRPEKIAISQATAQSLEKQFQELNQGFEDLNEGEFLELSFPAKGLKKSLNEKGATNISI